MGGSQVIFLSKIFCQHQVVQELFFDLFCVSFVLLYVALHNFSLALPNPSSRISWSIPKVGKVVQPWSLLRE